MKIKQFIIALTLCSACLTQTLRAQEIDYSTAYFDFDYPQTLNLGSHIKTFDLKVLILGDDPILAPNNISTDNDLNSKLNFKISFNGLQQVDSSKIGDLHIVSIVQRFLPKTGYSKNGGSLVADIRILTILTNTDGKELFRKQFSNEAFSATYPAGLTSGDVSKTVVENAISKSLESFQDLLKGYKARMDVKFASVEDVKKYPELKEFENQVKEIKKALSRDGVNSYLTTAEKYLPFWEQQSKSSIAKNPEEIRRAAYQNLGVYYILKGDLVKSREIIEAYKTIDKTQSEMMGLLKTKNSETLLLLIDKLNPKMKTVSSVSADKGITLKAVVSNLLYSTVNGIVVIDDKKNGGTYTGLVYIKKDIPTGKTTGGSITDIGGQDFDITIKTANGDIKSKLSKVKSLTDDKKNIYSVIKGGGNMLGDMSAVSIGNSSYILMKQTYVNSKISLYRIYFPINSSESSMLIKKKNDETGVRTTLINFRKNLTEYLSDCVETAALINNSQDINADINKILDTYGNCK